MAARKKAAPAAKAPTIRVKLSPDRVELRRTELREVREDIAQLGAELAELAAEAREAKARLVRLHARAEHLVDCLVTGEEDQPAQLELEAAPPPAPPASQGTDRASAVPVPVEPPKPAPPPLAPDALYRPGVVFAIATADHDADRGIGPRGTSLHTPEPDGGGMSWAEDETGARKLSDVIEHPRLITAVRSMLARKRIAFEEIAIPAPARSDTHVVFAMDYDAWHALDSKARARLDNPLRADRKKRAGEPNQVMWACSCWPADRDADDDAAAVIACAPVERGPLADAVRETGIALKLSLRELAAPVWTCLRCAASVLATYDPLTYGRLNPGGLCDACDKTVMDARLSPRAPAPKKRAAKPKASAKPNAPAAKPAPKAKRAKPTPQSSKGIELVLRADEQERLANMAGAEALFWDGDTEIVWKLPDDLNDDSAPCVSEPLSGEALWRAREFLELHAHGWVEQSDAGRISREAGLAPRPAKPAASAPPSDDRDVNPVALEQRAGQPCVVLVRAPGADTWYRKHSGAEQAPAEKEFKRWVRAAHNGLNDGMEVRFYCNGTLVATVVGDRTKKPAKAAKSTPPAADRGAPPAGPPGPLVVNVRAEDHATAKPPGEWTRTSIPLDRGSIDTMHSAALEGEALEHVRAALWAAAVLWDECTPGDDGACIRWVYPDGRQRLEDPDELVRQSRARHVVLGQERGGGHAGLWELLYAGESDADAARAERAARKRGEARYYCAGVLCTSTDAPPMPKPKRGKRTEPAEEAQAADG